MFNGPKLWNHILDHMPAGSIIAGGAVRDHYWGHDPKDIDVFVPNQVYEPPEQWAYQRPNEDRWKEYEGVEPGRIQDIADYKVDDIDVQLIRVAGDPFDYLKSFDLGTSRCCYNGGLYYSSDFMKDAVNNTVTILTTRNLERSRQRAQKIIERFPHKRIVEAVA